MAGNINITAIQFFALEPIKDSFNLNKKYAS